VDQFLTAAEEEEMEAERAGKSKRKKAA